jgi:hypothetical protein
LDIHRDSPVEILHSKLLGEDKYDWHWMTSDWKPPQIKTFADRLQAASTAGLSSMKIRANYIMQYRNNLIGKHFKILQQLTVFQLDDSLCNNLTLELWKASGELGALLWYDTIDDMKTYLVSIHSSHR